jgi:hypothetical protein
MDIPRVAEIAADANKIKGTPLNDNSEPDATERVNRLKSAPASE